MPTVMKTLDDLIQRQDRFDINKVTFYTRTDDGTLVIPDTNLFTIYRRYITQFIGVYKVTKQQRDYYRCKPYLLSTDIYGTPDLGWMILMLNDQESASKFRLKSTMRLIPGNILDSLYDTIVTKSNNQLQANWNEYLSDVDGSDDSE